MIDALFEQLSSWRGARIFHPHGVTVRGELEVGSAQGLAGTELFRPGRRFPAVVRLSRGIGLPQPAPDVLGLAIRAIDAYGDGQHQDLLVVTAAPVVGARFVLVPSRSFDGAAYSSLLPYRAGERRHLFGATIAARPLALRTLDHVARATEEGSFALVVTAARPGRPWQEVARFSATAVVPDHQGEALRFDPWHTGGGIVPDGLLQRWRASAYPASQRGRPDTLDPVGDHGGGVRPHGPSGPVEPDGPVPGSGA